MKTTRIVLITSLILILLPLGAGLAQETAIPVVKAVFFFSPNCGHCHMVINEVLIPMIDEYGEQLQIAAVDVTEQGGGTLFGQVINYLGLPQDEAVVPFLIIGETILIGSRDIPDQLPGLVSAGLEDGGIEWPPLPPIQASLPPEENTNPGPEDTGGAEPETSSPSDSPNAGEDALGDLSEAATAPPADPAGFTLAGLVLAGMVGSLGYSLLKFGSSEPIAAGKTRTRADYTKNRLYSLGVPLLGVLGLFVAGYLAYVEISQVAPVCGPVGECGLVQASPYARLFGVIPVAILGLFFYLTVLGLFIGLEIGALHPTRALISGWIGLTFLGTLFSIYLTIVELFFIKAVCMWCLSSAVLTAGLLVILANQNRKLIQPD